MRIANADAFDDPTGRWQPGRPVREIRWRGFPRS